MNQYEYKYHTWHLEVTPYSDEKTMKELNHMGNFGWQLVGNPLVIASQSGRFESRWMGLFMRVIERG